MSTRYFPFIIHLLKKMTGLMKKCASQFIERLGLTVLDEYYIIGKSHGPKKNKNRKIGRHKEKIHEKDFKNSGKG